MVSYIDLKALFSYWKPLYKSWNMFIILLQYEIVFNAWHPIPCSNYGLLIDCRPAQVPWYYICLLE